MGYLCKYLAGEGWTPVVVTEQVPGDTFDFLCEGVDVTYVPASRMASLTDVFFGRKTARLERAAERKLAERPCDVVLCSTYREFPLDAARRIARRHRLPLVVDLRDIIEKLTEPWGVEVSVVALKDVEIPEQLQHIANSGSTLQEAGSVLARLKERSERHAAMAAAKAAAAS